MRALLAAGAIERWVQTNSGSFQFHHNKFVVGASDREARAVFTGAGNFTDAAFEANFENHCVFTIPTVAATYDGQARLLWDGIATPESDLPRRFVEP